MIRKGIIRLTFLTAGFLIAFTPAFGQVTQQELEEWNRQDQERLEASIRENYSSNSSTPAFIERFLSHDPNSWAVSLFSVGGIFGTQMLASVNSQGKLFCRMNGDEVVTSDIAATELTEISRLLDDIRKRKRLTFTPSRKDIACNDCATYSVMINERKGRAIKDVPLELGVSGPDVAALFDKVKGLTACPAD